MDGHAECALGRAGRMGGRYVSATAVALVVVLVVAGGLDGFGIGNLLDEPRRDVDSLAEPVAAVRSGLLGDLDEIVRFGYRPPDGVVARVSADRATVGTEVVFVVGLGSRRALLTRWRVWILGASEAALKTVYLLVFPPGLGFEFFDSLLHRLQSVEKLFFGWP